MPNPLVVRFVDACPRLTGWLRSAFIAVTALVSVVPAGAASAQSSLPVNYDFGAAVVSTFASPTVSPPGATPRAMKSGPTPPR